MNPTILIFLKAPERGQVKTRLAEGIGAEAAREAYVRLVARQMAAMPDDWPLEVHFTPAAAEPVMRAWLGEAAGRRYVAQPEGDLGQRLAHAVAGAFERGAGAVLLIGGDCAELGVDQFKAAAEGLGDQDAVLGPSRDGGYYLLGLRAPQRQIFDGIAWSTAAVAAQTRDRLRAMQLRWVEIATLRDVDTAEDWEWAKNQI